jgi:hypothetical protein
VEAMIRQYPHIVKQIYLPDNYTAINLSGIISYPTRGPITTKSSIGFELHLPYHTKDGSSTSLLVAAGPDIAVNVILGLPFILAMGMIANFVDNVCKAKHLCCSPILINFKRATKSIPAFMDSAAHTFVSSTDRKVIHILGMLNAFYSSKKEGKQVHIIHQLMSTSIVPFH